MAWYVAQVRRRSWSVQGNGTQPSEDGAFRGHHILGVRERDEGAAVEEEEEEVRASAAGGFLRSIAMYSLLASIQQRLTLFRMPVVVPGSDPGSMGRT